MSASRFEGFASAVTRVVGNSVTFAIVSVCVCAFVFIGYLVDFSESWKLLSDNFSAWAPILLLLLLQSSQNKDTSALQAKLDELIAASDGARNSMIAIEERDETHIEHERRENDDGQQATERKEKEEGREGR